MQDYKPSNTQHIACANYYRGDITSGELPETMNWTYYDNQALGEAPLLGVPTRSRTLFEQIGCNETSNNGGTGCSYGYRTIDS